MSFLHAVTNTYVHIYIHPFPKSLGTWLTHDVGERHGVILRYRPNHVISICIVLFRITSDQHPMSSCGPTETGTVRAGFIPIGQPLDSSGAGGTNQGIKHSNGEIHHLGIVYDDMLMLELVHFICCSLMLLRIDSS